MIEGRLILLDVLSWFAYYVVYCGGNNFKDNPIPVLPFFEETSVVLVHGLVRESVYYANVGCSRPNLFRSVLASTSSYMSESS